MLLMSAARIGAAEGSAIPKPVTAADFTDLIERPPFRRFLSLSEALVLSGVARLPDGPVVTVWNRSTGEMFVVTASANSQGWRLLDLANSTDLRSVVATIGAGDQKIALRFDPNRLAPPKLDNQAKPGRRGEASLVVEALLRALDPAAARAFDRLPAEAQEKFRKAFTEFLSAYPSSSDDKRIGFIQRWLDQSTTPPAADSEAAQPQKAAASTPASGAKQPPKTGVAGTVPVPNEPRAPSAPNNAPETDGQEPALVPESAPQ